MDNQSFNDLRASGQLSVQTTGSGTPPTFANYTTTAGDPTLKPTMSNNFDLSVEWYPHAGTSLHAGAFYKRITDSVVYGAAQRNVTVAFTDGTTEQGVATTNDARTSTQAATVKGIEVGGRVFLDRLPGWLSGIGVEANYTYLDSKNPGDLYYDINGVAHNDVPLQGLSKHNANVAFLYEHNPFSLRIAYSWRSKYLQSTNANGTNQSYTFYTAPGVGSTVVTDLPIYGADYGTLDGGVTVKVNDRVSFQIQATNITNATQRTLMGGYPEVRCMAAVGSRATAVTEWASTSTSDSSPSRQARPIGGLAWRNFQTRRRLCATAGFFPNIVRRGRCSDGRRSCGQVKAGTS
jgi:TonB-dependent receptor